MKTYIINLEKRTDRLAHIEAQFIGRDEFEPEIVRPVEAENGAQSLFATLQTLCRKEMAKNTPCFLVVEDDHVFTPAYSKERLGELIQKAHEKGADVLLGGVHAKTGAFKSEGDGLVRLEHYTGTQFMVVFSKFYGALANVTLKKTLTQDAMMCCISDSLFCTVPFLSYQKQTGYSDCTEINNGRNIISPFYETERRMMKAERFRKGGFFPLG